MEKSRPQIILSAAITIDGKIATKTGDSKLSSIKDKQRLHKLRSKVDAIIVGKNTVKRDNPLLTVRKVKGKNPIRIILDSQGSISSKSKIIKTCKNIPTIIIVSKKISKKNLSRLKSFPLEVIVSGKKTINIKTILKILSKKKINKILLEGGGTINWEFLKNGLIDKVIVTVIPCLVGGIDSISLIQGNGFDKISQAKKLKLCKIIRQKNELVLYYSKF